MNHLKGPVCQIIIISRQRTLRHAARTSRVAPKDLEGRHRWWSTGVNMYFLELKNTASRSFGGFWPLRPKWAIPSSPITIQNMRFYKMMIFWQTDPLTLSWKIESLLARLKKSSFCFQFKFVISHFPSIFQFLRSCVAFGNYLHCPNSPPTINDEEGDYRYM